MDKKSILNELKEIELLFKVAKEKLNKLPKNFERVILNYHNEEASLHYCSRWGTKAIEEIVQNFEPISKEAEKQKTILRVVL